MILATKSGTPIIGQLATVIGWIWMVFTDSEYLWNSEHWPCIVIFSILFMLL